MNPRRIGMETFRKFLVLSALVVGAVGCGDGSLGSGSSTPSVFTETWKDGAGAWRAVDGNPITVASDSTCPAYQHEDVAFSGGRVVTRATIPVTEGEIYCLGAWIRPHKGAAPVLGLEVDDGYTKGLQEWPIGPAGLTSGYPTMTAIGTDPNEDWHWYSMLFVMDVGAEGIDLRDENFAGGAVDFGPIQLFAGECPAWPTAICATVD